MAGMDDIIAACMNYESSLGEVEDFPISNTPVWILGNEYSTTNQLEELRADVRTRIWMTYRKNFPEISDTGFTSDKGWGCMLRCGQMVLAESLLRYHLGRDWRWSPDVTDASYLRIMSLFEDEAKQPFSIHKIAESGLHHGKKVGEWYGPNTVAHVLKKLTPFDTWNNISVSVVMDNIFIIDEIKSSSETLSEKGFRPQLIFIPVRLGVSEVNPIYVSGLKKCFQMPQCLGIIGGKTNHALFFVGSMGEEIVYLDPHTTQESGSLGDKMSEESRELLDSSYHCKQAQRLPFEQLDPSLALCFFCRNEKELDDLCNRLKHEIIDGEPSPLIEMFPTRPRYLIDGGGVIAIECDAPPEESDYDGDEDFEILE